MYVSMSNNGGCWLDGKVAVQKLDIYIYMYHDLACACRWNIGSCAARSLWLKSPGGSSVDQSGWPA